MSLRVPPEYEALVQRLVESGRYNSATDVVEAALPLLDERDRLTELRALIAEGDEQIARGDVLIWTPYTMEQLIREADEEDRLGLPIDDDVMP